jgi:hypothetical protein
MLSLKAPHLSVDPALSDKLLVSASLLDLTVFKDDNFASVHHRRKTDQGYKGDTTNPQTLDHESQSRALQRLNASKYIDNVPMGNN